jgi:hypothetical protein
MKRSPQIDEFRPLAIRPGVARSPSPIKRRGRGRVAIEPGHHRFEKQSAGLYRTVIVRLRSRLLELEIAQLSDASEGIGAIAKLRLNLRGSCMQPRGSVIGWLSDAVQEATTGVADEPAFEGGAAEPERTSHPEFVRNLSGISRNG